MPCRATRHLPGWEVAVLHVNMSHTAVLFLNVCGTWVNAMLACCWPRHREHHFECFGYHTLHVVSCTTASCQTRHRHYGPLIPWYCYVVCSSFRQAVSMLVSYKLPVCSHLILQTTTMLVAVLSFLPHASLSVECLVECKLHGCQRRC